MTHSPAPLWASLLYGEPLAVSVFRNETLCRAADSRLTGSQPSKIDAHVLDLSPRAMSHEATHLTDSGRKPYAMKNGIAVIKAFGTMTKRGGFMDAESGMIGYDWLLGQVRTAYRDPDVLGIFLMIDSPGGHAARLFETANEISLMSKADGGKPIYAYLDEEACSAAYVIACSADVVLGPKTCMGGSLGVILNVLDTSRLHEKMGVDPVIIRSSWADRKARPQDGEKVDDEAIASLQKIVDEKSDTLLEWVSAMRGISTKSIMDMRGEVFHGSEMFKLGLLDELCSEREAWALLEEETRSL